MWHGLSLGSQHAWGFCHSAGNLCFRVLLKQRSWRTCPQASPPTRPFWFFWKGFCCGIPCVKLIIHVLSMQNVPTYACLIIGLLAATSGPVCCRTPSLRQAFAVVGCSLKPWEWRSMRSLCWVVAEGVAKMGSSLTRPQKLLGWGNRKSCKVDEAAGFTYEQGHFEAEVRVQTWPCRAWSRMICRNVKRTVLINLKRTIRFDPENLM